MMARSQLVSAGSEWALSVAMMSLSVCATPRLSA
jgi:hypothetical protein